MHCTVFGPLSLILVLTAASGCVGVAGNGHRARETRELRAFSKIESHGPFAVDAARGDDFTARVSIDSNLIDHLETHVYGDTLEIDSDAWIADLLPGPHLVITLPRLESATVSGSGDLVIHGFDSDEPLRLSASGSSDLTFDGSAPKITASVSGSGDMQLHGGTEFAELEVSGSGNLDARELIASEADVTVSGSGNLRATIDGPVGAAVSGSGDIDLYGDVQREHFSESGSGDIRVH
jgi:hypothetical protein